MMSVSTKESLTAICRMDGAIVAVSPALISLTEVADQHGNGLTTLTELANLIDSNGLNRRVEEFATSQSLTDNFTHQFKSGEGQVLLQKLGRKRGAPLQQQMILISLDLQSHVNLEKDLLRAGRMTSQLVHDFKNQIGGIKLYAAYLKKRFADSTEGLEITEKIVQGLNAMAEHASLVSKLTRPLELNRQSADLAALLLHSINDYRPRAEARCVKLESELGSGSAQAVIDAQQLRVAISALLARAVDSSAENGRIQIRLHRETSGFLIEIVDQGGTLSVQQRGALFELLPGEKLNQAAFGLAMARRIIERHGGEATAVAAPESGTTVRLRIPV